MKSLKQRNIEFFDFLSRYYDNGTLKSLLARKHKRILKLIHIKNNSKILDAGCGTGDLLLHLYDKNLDLYGIDISKNMLEIAEKRLNGTAKFSLQSVEELNFKDNYFDYIFSIDAFHHYSDYELTMRNFYRTLRKGGYLIVVDFDFGNIINSIFHKIEPGNSRMYSGEEFIKLFMTYKFDEIKQKRLSLCSIFTVGEKLY